MPDEIFYELMSSDQKIGEISGHAIRQSKTLTDFIRDFPTVQPIPVNDVTGEILKIIVEWCEDPTWDMVEIEDNKLYELTRAADSLQIRRLVVLLGNRVEILAEGKTPEQVMAICGAYTEEELNQLADRMAEMHRLNFDRR